MRAMTKAGDWQSWTALLATGIVVGGSYRALALGVAPKLIGVFSVCRVIKHFSRRPRPSKSVDGFLTLLTDPDPYSFPSAHAACAWTVCITLGTMLGGGWAFWIAYPTLISYSRVHVGAHYPLDVVIGTAIGVAVGLS